MAKSSAISCVKNLDVAAHAGSLLNRCFVENKISELREVVFEKTKIQKYWSNFTQETFSKAIDRGVKTKETLGEHTSTLRSRHFSIETPFLIKQ